MAVAYPDRVTFGVDADYNALRFGRRVTPQARFVNARAEALPFKSNEFDFVIARLSLPYTELRYSIPELRRVLRKHGRVWLVFHPLAIPWKEFRAKNVRGKLYFAFIVLNSLLFAVGARQFSIGGGIESFQTRGGIRRALVRAGFDQITFPQSAHLIATARAC